jgi:peptidoglycan hydrolase CwlO-like protein
MNDQAQRLRSAIAELEHELAHLESSDPETRALLAEAAQDIRATLERMGPQETSPTGDVTQSKSLIEEKMLEFEASHPRLSLALTRIIDALGQLGI